MNKPNIVVVMADQLAPQFCGAYGGQGITPHIDALAQRGMRFDAAYCNSPLCAPSRFSFMSGQLISRIAAYDNACEFNATVPTFAHYLRMLGYRTCLSGKMHFVGPDQKHGFEDRVTTDIYPSDFAWTPDWEAHDERIDKWYHNMQTVKESGMAMATFQIDYDDEVGFAARRARPEWWNLYNDEDIDMPAFVPSLDELDPFSRRLMDGIEASYVPLNDEEVRRARRAYLANVSYFDSKVGELVNTLDEIGELDNTIVIVTADHGDMLGERGLWYKMNFFEHSARVPLIMAGPAVKQGTAPNACSLVDLLPTFIDVGGGDDTLLGEPIDGRTLMPLARGESDPVDQAIGEYCAEMTPYPVIMIRRGTLKYIHCDFDPPQLYDVANDPLETTNLASEPDYSSEAQAFAEEVAARWDGDELRSQVIATQKSRRALYAAMEHGNADHWDYNPPSDASQQYVRNHMDWTVAAERYRYPQTPKQSS